MIKTDYYEICNQKLKYLNYSDRTIKSYLYYINQFFEITKLAPSRLTSNDLIEHSSFWRFKYTRKAGRFWGTVHTIKSREKLYPLGRKHGQLQILDGKFFYYYNNLRVPIFYYNKPIPSLYINPKYLTLCKITKNISSQSQSNKKTNSKNNERKTTSITKILKQLKNNRFVS